MMTASSFLPLTFLFFPRIAVEHSGLGAWWAIVGIALVGYVIAWVHSALNERFSTLTGADMALKVFGRWLGSVVLAVYLCAYILFVALCTYFFTDMLAQFMPKTPLGVMYLSIVGVGCIGALYGPEALARVCCIGYPLLLFGNISTLLVIPLRVPASGVSFSWVSWTSVLAGVYYLMPIYLGFNIVLMLSPYYARKPRKSKWMPFISMGLSQTVMIPTFLVCVMILGYGAITHIEMPVPFVFRLLRLSGFVIERVGVTVIILATFSITLFISNHLWAMATVMARTFRISDHRFHFFILPVCVLCTGIDIMVFNEQEAFQLLNTVLVPMSWLLLLGVPLLMLAVAKVRGLKSADSQSFNQSSSDE